MKKSRFQKAAACGLCAAFILGAAAPFGTASAATKAEQAQAKQMYKAAYGNYRNGNIIAAADSFMAASKMDESNPLISMSAGDMLRRLKQYPSAIKYYQMSVDNFRHAPKGTKDRVILQTYSGLAQSYMETGDTEKAVENAQEVVNHFRKKYNGYFLLGQIYADKHKDDAKAIEYFNKALDMDDTQVDVYTALTDLYKQKDDKAGMEAALKKGCLARPLDETMKAKLGQLYLDWTDGTTNHYAEAEQVFKDLVGLDENSAWGHYYLGISYTMQGKFDDASNELATLTSLNKNLANRLQKEMEQQKESSGSQDDASPTITIQKAN